MRQYNSVEDLRQDFSNINKRVSGYQGPSDQITDSALLTELRDFNSRLSTFISHGGGSDRTSDQSTSREATR